MESNPKENARRELLTFFAAAFGLSWLLWLGALLVHKRGGSWPLFATFLLRAGTFGPSIAGLALAYGFGGKTQLRALLRSLVRFRFQPRWWLYLFLVPAGVSAVSCLIFALAVGPLPPVQIPLPLIPLAFVAIMILMGPLGEEAGWRGFALVRMLRSASPIRSAIQLGIVWSAWHLPLFFIEGTTQNALTAFGFPPAFACYLVYTVLISILITLLYIKSNGSALSAIAFHTMSNLSVGVVPLIFSKSGAAILLLVLSAVCAWLIYRNKKVMWIRQSIEG